MHRLQLTTLSNTEDPAFERSVVVKPRGERMARYTCAVSEDHRKSKLIAEALTKLHFRLSWRQQSPRAPLHAAENRADC